MDADGRGGGILRTGDVMRARADWSVFTSSAGDDLLLLLLMFAIGRLAFDNLSGGVADALLAVLGVHPILQRLLLFKRLLT